MAVTAAALAIAALAGGALLANRERAIAERRSALGAAIGEQALRHRRRSPPDSRNKKADPLKGRLIEALFRRHD